MEIPVSLFQWNSKYVVDYIETDFLKKKNFLHLSCLPFISLQYWGLGAAADSVIRRGKTKILVSGEIEFDAPMAPGGTATSRYEGEVVMEM